MYEARKQKTQTFQIKIEIPIPSCCEDLSKFFNQQKGSFRGLMPNDRIDHMLNYAKMCSCFLDIILRNKNEWQIANSIVRRAQGIQVDLQALIIKYDETLNSIQRGRKREETDISEIERNLEACLDQTETIANDFFSPDSDAAPLKEGEGIKTSTRTGEPLQGGSVGPRHFEQDFLKKEGARVKKWWFLCSNYTDGCNRLIPKLMSNYRRNEVFAKEGLSEINTDIILHFCDTIVAFVSMLEKNPLALEWGNIPTDFHILKTNIEGLRKYVYEVDVPNVFECFNNIRNYLLKMHNLEGLPG